MPWTVFRAATILALVMGTASAHHPFSVNYDPAKFATLTGRVVKVQWTNPHVAFALEVENAAQGRERWVVEGLPPGTLRRQGWNADSLREGTRISISGWHARNAALKIFSGYEVTFEDGSTRLFGTSPGTGDKWRCADGGTDCETAQWIPTIAE